MSDESFVEELEFRRVVLEDAPDDVRGRAALERATGNVPYELDSGVLGASRDDRLERSVLDEDA